MSIVSVLLIQIFGAIFFAHLKKDASTGHLLKTSTGHLSKACPTSVPSCLVSDLGIDPAASNAWFWITGDVFTPALFQGKRAKSDGANVFNKTETGVGKLQVHGTDSYLIDTTAVGEIRKYNSTGTEQWESNAPSGSIYQRCRKFGDVVTAVGAKFGGSTNPPWGFWQHLDDSDGSQISTENINDIRLRDVDVDDDNWYLAGQNREDPQLNILALQKDGNDEIEQPEVLNWSKLLVSGQRCDIRRIHLGTSALFVWGIEESGGAGILTLWAIDVSDGSIFDTFKPHGTNAVDLGGGDLHVEGDDCYICGPSETGVSDDCVWKIGFNAGAGTFDAEDYAHQIGDFLPAPYDNNDPGPNAIIFDGTDVIVGFDAETLNTSGPNLFSIDDSSTFAINYDLCD